MTGIRAGWWFIIAAIVLSSLTAVAMGVVLVVTGGDTSTYRDVFRSTYPVVASIIVLLVAIGAVGLILQRRRARREDPT